MTFPTNIFWRTILFSTLKTFLPNYLVLDFENIFRPDLVSGSLRFASMRVRAYFGLSILIKGCLGQSEGGSGWSEELFSFHLGNINPSTGWRKAPKFGHSSWTKYAEILACLRPITHMWFCVFASLPFSTLLVFSLITLVAKNGVFAVTCFRIILQPW